VTQLAAPGANPGEGRAHRSSTPSAVHSPPVRRYVLAGVVIAVVLVALGLVHSEGGSLPQWWAGLPALVAAFGLAEVAALQVEVRRGTVSIPLNELPLGAALLLLPLPVALSASLLVLVGRALWRRQHPVIAAFNLAATSIEIATAYLVVDLLVGRAVPELLAVLCALVLSNVTASINGLGLSLAMGSDRRAGLRSTLSGTLTTMTIVMPLLVVLGAQLVRSGPYGWLLVAGVLLAFAVLYRAYSVLLRERRDVGIVQDISQVVGQSDDVWPRVAELFRQQFNARRAIVRAPDGGPAAVAGDPCSSDADLGRDVLAASTSTRLVTLSGAASPVAAALAARGVAEVLVAPLGVGRGAGSIELHDRQNQLRGFGAGDVRLLDTLARHVSTAVDNHRLLAELRGAAYHDRLTGLSNRLGFVELAASAVASSADLRTASRTCGVVLLDLGALGPVNDALGHLWGDRFVVQAAERVQAAVEEAVGPGPVLGRVEGDVFAVLLLDHPAEECVRLAEVLAARLAPPFPLDELTVEASPAVGVSVVVHSAGQPGPDVEAMLQHADVAVQEARVAGQPVRTYHEGMGLRFLRRFQLVTQFRAALAAGQVTVHYQPKVALPGREVVGSEALMRWTHPEFGPVDPEELVRVLEATGLMDDLTHFVLHDALRRCRTMLDRGLRIAPAVNVSVRNLLSPGFPGMISAALAEHDVPAEMLTLEITETSVMGDAERTLPALRVLHEMGVALSVDDFGTGYSSLSYLRRLPVDEVKIDKSFVARIETDLGDLAVVRAIIDLGRSLGLRVVAEGVETDVVRDLLAEMGCDVVQGYLISRPLDPERFDAWLHTRTVLAPGGVGRAPVSPRLSR
jgi:diguanylate cyclase (GGDEF)-like protein